MTDPSGPEAPPLEGTERVLAIGLVLAGLVVCLGGLGGYLTLRGMEHGLPAALVGLCVLLLGLWRAGRLARWGRPLFVALHLFAVTAMAMPSAGSGLTRSAWKDPTVQGEFRSWTERLQGFGVQITQPELEELAWNVASGFEDVRNAVLAPFEPYYVYCGTWQSWRMFVAPHRYPGRLEIHVDRGKGFEPLYIARSPEHTWHRDQLDHDRSRAAIFRYSWKHYKRWRGQFTDWVAREVAAEDPTARRVRVSWMRYRTPSPEEVRAGQHPKEERQLSNSRGLAELRGTP